MSGFDFSGIGKQLADAAKQSYLEQNELNNARNQEDAEKRRIDEKQTRALRGQYSGGNYGNNNGGLKSLGYGQPASPDMMNKLGG